MTTCDNGQTYPFNYRANAIKKRTPQFAGCKYVLVLMPKVCNKQQVSSSNMLQTYTHLQLFPAASQS